MQLIIDVPERHLRWTWEIDSPTAETLAIVLANCEHERRMVRCTPEDPRNIPFKRLNHIGDELGDALDQPI
jgi:hypothetical protein